MHNVELITTGGTIEKTYDERTGTLGNTASIVDRMLRRLKLTETRVHTRQLLSKDSTEFTDEDRDQILRAVQASAAFTDAIVILHGTDTLPHTGEFLHDRLGIEKVRVVLTGAMRPYEMRRSDALQNLTEAILASQLLEPGVHFVGHGKALAFPGVVKDYDKGTFVKKGIEA